MTRPTVGHRRRLLAAFGIAALLVVLNGDSTASAQSIVIGRGGGYTTQAPGYTYPNTYQAYPGTYQGRYVYPSQGQVYSGTRYVTPQGYYAPGTTYRYPYTTANGTPYYGGQQMVSPYYGQQTTTTRLGPMTTTQTPYGSASQLNLGPVQVFRNNAAPGTFNYGSAYGPQPGTIMISPRGR